jgi:phosphoribosylanthranilate isomerase
MKTERTRIKICGIREPAHARIAAEAGADAIGLVFHRASPRFLEAEQAAAIAAALPPFVTAVALFVNEDPHTIRRLVHSVRIDLLQFHGDETPEFCGQFGKPFVRAVRMEKGVDLVEYARRFPAARALLLDAHVPDQPGGTGTTFDWTAIPRGLPIPLILAGGLDVSNVGTAIRTVRPWAVDVSSGVEAGRGVKDPRKIVEFIRKVRHEDGQVPA